MTKEVDLRVICIKMDIILSMWIRGSAIDLVVRRSRRSVVACSAEEDEEGKGGK